MKEFIINPFKFFSTIDKISNSFLATFISIEVILIIICEMFKEFKTLDLNLIIFNIISKMICYPLFVAGYSWSIEKVGTFPNIKSPRDKIFIIFIFSVIPLIFSSLLNTFVHQNFLLINFMKISLKLWFLLLLLIGFKVVLKINWLVSFKYLIIPFLILITINNLI
ncbi:hypothetical protein L1S34_07215 [Flavobacterium sp. K77]|uniref:hypothetical protein n=1 Tax=Flavobacterium sp. K77 TaxID=2910676 RepID=UPI001F238890|nr:hypothetical protein [Flavobacterium sp. K77]MCF6141070.1 hypothetical protein [Flavobacterium sp. K77]